MKPVYLYLTAVVALLALCFASPARAQAPICCNILFNGNFEQGAAGFTSGLPQNCACAASSYCVGANLQVKCGGWHDLPDHTTGAGDFLIVDGDESSPVPVDVWRTNTNIANGVTYCFSFWVASEYDQPFDLGLAVNGNPVSGAVFSVQQGTPAWTQYTFTWTATGPGTNISIQQLAAGAFQDFGIDDIEFGQELIPNFAASPNLNCGTTVQFINQSTGPSPLTYSWNFGDAGSPGNTSSQQNPVHNFSGCSEYEVCLTISRGACSATYCENVVVVDDEPPAVTCPAGVSVMAGPPSCNIAVNGIKWLTATDNCGTPTVNYSVTGATSASGQNDASGTVFNVGISTVMYTATDKCGNTKSCSFEVQVNGGVELCNGLDDDCDGEIDNNLAVCLPPTNLAVSNITSTSATLSWTPSNCSDGTWTYIDDEAGVKNTWIHSSGSTSSIVFDDLTPGTTYYTFVVSNCDSIMSAHSDTILFNYPCYGGYTPCPGSIVNNGSFEIGAAGFPNGPDQINQAANWQQSVNGSNVSGVGEWFSHANGLFHGFYNDVPNQQYTTLLASCGLGYAGFDLNSCEGISTQLTASVAPGSGYSIGFWWSPKEPVASNFTFLAILSGANCTVNAANGGTVCTHQCAGDFHVPVTVTPAHQPGTWYFHTYTANAPMSFTHLTFAANIGGPIVNNYIYVDEVCVRLAFLPCVVKARITYNPDQPNAFLSEADLGAGSSVVSVVWDFDDGTSDSSCCLGSVIHDFAPGIYNVCLMVTAMDSSGMTCSDSVFILVNITASGGPCDEVAAFLQQSNLGDCCYDLIINNTAANTFSQIDITLSSGSFVNSVFGPGWNIAVNGNMVSLTPTGGGFIPPGQATPVTICDPGGTQPYTLDVDFAYGGGICQRSFNFSCSPDTADNCCSDFNLFQLIASQVQTNEQYNDCFVSVNATGLTDCMRILWNWGDGSTEGPYTNGTGLTHTYTTAGPHTVCYTVQEVDANGVVCWDYDDCLDLPVHCNDTCSCLGFTNLTFSLGSGIAQIWSLPVDCENQPALPLPCIANDAYYEFQGDFGCSNACSSSIGYEVFNGNQLVSFGQANYFSPFIPFSIPPFNLSPGTYQLVLTGLCGTEDSCICNVNFTIPVCTCCSADFTAFSLAVDNATSITQDLTNCKATLNIGILPCQRIDWVNWGDGIIDLGPFLSGTMPMHIYSQSGPHTISFSATEINTVTGLVCFQKTFTETIALPCVPECSCGTYDMEIRVGGAPNFPANCGETWTIGLNQGFALYTSYQCQGPDCPMTTQIDWQLSGPAGFFLSGTETATPGFTITPVNPGQFGVPGLYILTMIAHCGLDECPCVIYFNVTDPCCTDEAAFLVAAANVQTFGTLGTCTLSFQGVGLNDCMRISYDWGDNSGSGPFSDNTPVTHTYTATGTYNVCSTIQEIDFFGNVCWTYESCEQVFVICNDCVCGTFSEMFARPSVGAPSIALACGQMYAFGCPAAGHSIPITGKFECQGANCPPATQVNWTLTKPSGTTISGVVGAGPYFYLPILPLDYAQPGVYTLVLQGNCGGQPCPPCVIHFSVNCPDPCPCDPVQFQADVALGFANALWSNSCKACFAPIALNDCDMVQWSVNGGPVIGMTNGTQSFCHVFPSSGVYVVTMTVIRKKSDGSVCAQVSISKTVTITCIDWTVCPTPVFANPRFSEGAVAGGLNSGGVSLNWMALSGEPVVVEGEPNSQDGWTIQLTGKLDTADVLTQVEPLCLEKSAGTASLRYGIKEKGIKSSLSVQLFRGDDFELEEWNPIRCLRLVSIDLSPFDTGWIELQLPYDLSMWGVLDSCGDAPHGVLVRPIVYVTNALGSGQGGAETRSSIQIDNFCFDGTLVGLNALYAGKRLRIFPNPNPGMFTVELPGAAKPGMALRIVGLTGQVLMEKPAEAGSTQQSIRADNLPNGLYFLQVVSEGRVLAVEKFVKQ